MNDLAVSLLCGWLESPQCFQAPCHRAGILDAARQQGCQTPWPAGYRLWESGSAESELAQDSESRHISSSEAAHIEDNASELLMLKAVDEPGGQTGNKN